MTRRFPPVIALALALALVLPALAQAKPTTQTAHAGQVTATFTFTFTTSTKDSFPTYSGETLTITRDGATAYSAPVADPDCDGCTPGAPEANESSVQVVDLDNTGEPNVILTLFTGGAHCCTIAQVFSYDAATGTYTKARQNFEDPAFDLKRLVLGGDYLFVSANAAFEYEYTSYAQSADPIQIWSFADGAFTDVTRSYPALIAKNAALWFRLFKHNLSDGTGPLAAWAADEQELGHNALVRSTLKAQLKAGHLVGGFVNGKKYITLLNKQLRKLGYEK
jgi:hypothetical protein